MSDPVKKRTGAKLFENDSEWGCRYALVGEIWVVPGNCGENGEHINHRRYQSVASAYRSNRLVGDSRGRKEGYYRICQLRGERSVYRELVPPKHKLDNPWHILGRILCFSSGDT